MGNQDSTASAKFHVTKKSFGVKLLELQPSVGLFLRLRIVHALATLFAEWVRPRILTSRICSPGTNPQAFYMLYSHQSKDLIP